MILALGNIFLIKETYGEYIYTNPYIKLLDETQPDFDPNEQKDNKVNYTEDKKILELDDTTRAKIAEIWLDIFKNGVSVKYL